MKYIAWNFLMDSIIKKKNKSFQEISGQSAKLCMCQSIIDTLILRDVKYMMKHMQIKKTLLQIKLVQKYLEECALNIFIFLKWQKFKFLKFVRCGQKNGIYFQEYKTYPYKQRMDIPVSVALN